MITISQMFAVPGHKYFIFFDQGTFEVADNVPVISSGYRGTMPACTGCAMLDTKGLAALAHISPYESSESFAEGMLIHYEKLQRKAKDISAVVAGVNEREIVRLAEYLIVRQVRVQTHIVPQLQGNIRMGVDPKSRTFVLERDEDKLRKILTF